MMIYPKISLRVNSEWPGSSSMVLLLILPMIAYLKELFNSRLLAY